MTQRIGARAHSAIDDAILCAFYETKPAVGVTSQPHNRGSERGRVAWRDVANFLIREVSAQTAGVGTNDGDAVRHGFGDNRNTRRVQIRL